VIAKIIIIFFIFVGVFIISMHNYKE